MKECGEVEHLINGLLRIGLVSSLGIFPAACDSPLSGRQRPTEQGSPLAQAVSRPETTPIIEAAVQRGRLIPREQLQPATTGIPIETPAPTETSGPTLLVRREGKNTFDVHIRKITIISEPRGTQFALHVNEKGEMTGDVDVVNDAGELTLVFGDKVVLSAVARNPDGVGAMRIYQNKEPRCGELAGSKIDGTCTIQDPKKTDPKEYSATAAPDGQGRIEFSAVARVSGDDNWLFPDSVTVVGRVAKS